VPVALPHVPRVQVCIFSDGQTGTGKTHTMLGRMVPAERGIIPRAIALLEAKAEARDPGLEVQDPGKQDPGEHNHGDGPHTQAVLGVAQSALGGKQRVYTFAGV